MEHQTGTLLMQVWFYGVASDFSPRVNFQHRFSYGTCTPLCACINICVHVKDPVVHVRVLWIMETLKHSACTVGWVAQLCCSWLSPGKATQISHGRDPIGTKVKTVVKCWGFFKSNCWLNSHVVTSLAVVYCILVPFEVKQSVSLKSNFYRLICRLFVFSTISIPFLS